MKLQQIKGSSLRRGAVVGMAAIAVVGLGGGYALGASGTLTTPTVSAHGNDNNGNRRGWNSDQNNSQLAYIVDAVEVYLAKQQTPAPTPTADDPNNPTPDPDPTPPTTMDPDTTQVTKVMVSGQFAIGHLDNGDSSSLFFAQKTDGKWTVLYSGQDVTDEAKQMLEKAGVPKNWVTKPQEVKTDD